MAGIAGRHHVFGIKHLLRQLRNSKSPVLLTATSSQRGKAGHEEVKPGERHHVHSQLAKIGIKLARETEASSDPRHGERHQVVQVTIGGVVKLERTEANIIQSFIVNAIGFISVLHKLVNRESGIVGFNNSVGDLGRWHYRVSVHDPVRVFLPDLGDEESSHARAGSSAKRVGHLEALQTIGGFRLFANYIQNRINQLGSFGVMSFRPIVAGSRVAENVIVRPENLSIRTGPDRVHRTRFQIDENSPGHVHASAGLVVVDIDAFELKIGGAFIVSIGVDAVLVGDNLPELKYE